MNKKIALALIPILLIGVGLGALVDYLSNTVTLQNVQIESPIALSDISGSISVHGGDTQSYSYYVKNNANNEIKGVFKFVIHEPDNATTDDLTSYNLTVGGTSYNLTASQSGNDYILTSEPVPLTAGDKVTATWTITFNPAIKNGTYSFETVVVPAPASNKG